ncbi:MAG: hypothetical protein M1826_006083 [Phylliscum demangeonii]|nr:MAG: hypothetical protein M1826_006083 [Phylliscum demangeonii]
MRSTAWSGRAVEDVLARWLQSVAVCCAPGDAEDGHDATTVQDERSKDALAVNGEKTMGICYDEPRLIPPPRPDPRTSPSQGQQQHRHQRSASRSSTLTAKWMGRSRSLASRASSIGSILVPWTALTSKPTSRLPAIGLPSDFRRVECDAPRQPELAFRPLELSIYRPQNRLSPLPDFRSTTTSPDDLDDLFLAGPELASVGHDRHEQYRSSLLRMDSALSHQPCSSSAHFRIARKPVSSIVPLCWAADPASSRQPFDAGSASSVFGADWIVQPLRPRPSLSLSSRSQEPQAPSVRARSSVETARRQSQARHSASSHFMLYQKANEILFEDEPLRMPSFDERIDPFHVRPEPAMLSNPSILSRPHPLKPLPSLPARVPTPLLPAAMLRSSIRRISGVAPEPMPTLSSLGSTTAPSAAIIAAHTSSWVFPTSPDLSSSSSPTATTIATCAPPHASAPHASPPIRRTITRSSTISTMATSASSLDDLPMPPTPSTGMSAQSSPSPGARPTPIRQRTFGFRETSSPFRAGQKAAVVEDGAGVSLAHRDPESDHAWPSLMTVDEQAHAGLAHPTATTSAPAPVVVVDRQTIARLSGVAAYDFHRVSGIPVGVAF